MEGSSEIAENVTLAVLFSKPVFANRDIHLRCPKATHEAISHLNASIKLHDETEEIDSALPLTSLTTLPSLLDQPSLRPPDSSAAEAPDRIETIGVCLDSTSDSGLLTRDLAPLVQLDSLNFRALCASEDTTPAAFTLATVDGDTPLAKRIAAHDLIIGGDGPAIRLAAQLGAPVWLLCRRFPDWIWGLEGETTDRYPNVRLFRQARCGDWHTPVASLISELRKRAG